MKAIIFDHIFEAPEELEEFCKTLGYDFPNYRYNRELMFDSRVIEFCEERLSEFGDVKVYKGKKDNKYKIGCAGIGCIYDIDTSRGWRIIQDNSGFPRPVYIDVLRDEYGYITIKSYNE